MQRLIYTEVDKVIHVSLDKSIHKTDASSGYSGMMTFGNDNGNPQTIERLVHNSTTGKAVVDIVSRFLISAGFEVESINSIVVGQDSRGKEITVKSLLRKVVYDIILFNGFYVHTSWNANHEVGEYTHTPFKDCRFAKPDQTGYSPKILTSLKWVNPSRKDKKTIKDYSIFTINKASFISQVNKQADGEIEKYNGQMYFAFLDENFFYPTSPFAACYLSLDTEFQLQIHKNRTVRNGFLPKTLMRVSPPESEQEQKKLEKKLKDFIGVDGENFMAIYDNSLSDEGEIQGGASALFENIEGSINPDLFNNWVTQLQTSIRLSWGVPQILIDFDAGKLGTTSGETIRQASEKYDELLNDTRTFISESFAEIFKMSANEELSTNTNWNIKRLDFSSKEETPENK